MYELVNNGFSSLASNFAIGAGSLTVQAPDGSKFPDSGVFKLILWRPQFASPSLDEQAEIVTLNGAVGNVFPVVSRGDELTGQRDWTVDDRVACVVTAAVLQELQTAIAAVGATGHPHDQAVDKTDDVQFAHVGLGGAPSGTYRVEIPSTSEQVLSAVTTNIMGAQITSNAVTASTAYAFQGVSAGSGAGTGYGLAGFAGDNYATSNNGIFGRTDANVNPGVGVVGLATATGTAAYFSSFAGICVDVVAGAGNTTPALRVDTDYAYGVVTLDCGIAIGLAVLPAPMLYVTDNGAGRDGVVITTPGQDALLVPSGGGAVGIGIATVPSGYLMQIDGGSTDTALGILSSVSSGSGAVPTLEVYNNGTGTNAYAFYAQSAGLGTVNVAAAGELTAGTNGYAVFGNVVSTTGTTIGVYGVTATTVGVKGHATGAGVGVQASSVTGVPLHIVPVASAPSGAAGDIYYDSGTNTHYGHNGTGWQALY